MNDMTPEGQRVGVPGSEGVENSSVLSAHARKALSYVGPFVVGTVFVAVLILGPGEEALAAPDRDPTPPPTPTVIVPAPTPSGVKLYLAVIVKNALLGSSSSALARVLPEMTQ